MEELYLYKACVYALNDESSEKIWTWAENSTALKEKSEPCGAVGGRPLLALCGFVEVVIFQPVKRLGQLDFSFKAFLKTLTF